MEVLSLEEFKKAIETIKDFENEIRQISNITIKECTGFIDFHFKIIDLATSLLSRAMNDDSEWLDWWLNEKVEKIIYLNNERYDYDVENVEDLYYYLTKQYEKIKRIKASDSSK